MNHEIINPKGIDEQIQYLQGVLFKNLDWGDIDVFGRIRKNPSQTTGFYPEAYVGDREYRDLYLNDEVNATICFIEDETHTADDFNQFWFADLKCVVMVNLEKCYPNILHRADTEAQIDVLNQLKKNRMFSEVGIEKGIPNIFKGFNIERITTDDMHPFHIFAITGTIKYKINC